MGEGKREAESSCVWLISISATLSVGDGEVYKGEWGGEKEHLSRKSISSICNQTMTEQIRSP